MNRTLLWVSTLSVAMSCTSATSEPPVLDWESATLPTGERPPPALYEFTLAADPFFVGGDASVTVTGPFLAGDVLHLVGSPSGHAAPPGGGACFFSWCFDLLPPLTPVVSELAGVDGVHTFEFALPHDPAMVGDDFGLQVIHPRFGPPGWELVVSNPLLITLDCPPADRDCSGVCFGPDAPFTFWTDGDGDGFGDPSAPVEACALPPGAADNAEDCNDAEPSAYPGAIDLCGDGLDADCDGLDTRCGLTGEHSLGDCGTRIVGPASAAGLGVALAAEEDFNGDGVVDLVIAGNDLSGADAGTVWIVDGTVTGDYVIDPADPLTLVEITGVDPAGEMGYLGLTTGDFNGDGIAEIAIGATGVKSSPGLCADTSNGNVYVIEGPFGGGGLSGPHDAGVSYAVLEGADTGYTGVVCYSDYIGYELDNAGDVDGDGIDDLLVNSQWMWAPEDITSAYLAFGSDTGAMSGDISLVPGVRFENAWEPIGPYPTLPRGVGDLNADGFRDVMVSNVVDDARGAFAGASYIYFGPFDDGEVLTELDADLVIEGAHAELWFPNTQTGLHAADFNDDGFLDLGAGSFGVPDPVAYPGMYMGAGFLFYGPFGPGVISTDAADAWWHGEVDGDDATDFSYAGDVNGDGHSDVVIGGDLGTGPSGLASSGTVHVFFGPHGGETLLAEADLLLEGEGAGDQAGWGVYTVGDLDEDGFDDIAVTAPGSDAGGVDSGAVYVCYGGDTGQCSSTPPATHPVEIDPACVDTSYDYAEEWSWYYNDLTPTHDGVMSHPAVAPLVDTNLDGLVDERDVPAVVFNAYESHWIGPESHVVAVRGDTGATLWSSGGHGTYNTGQVAIGDVDGDGRPNVVAASDDGVVCLDNDGSFLWEAPAATAGYGHPSIADIDGDGVAEVIYGKTVINADGSVRWVGDGCRGSSQLQAHAVDMDQITDPADPEYGLLEVVAGCTVYNHDGTIRWSAPESDGYTAVGNFDADPQPEIAMVIGELIVFDHDGTVLWRDASVTGARQPAVADFDGDGEAEIGVLKNADAVAVFDADGTELWSAVVSDPSALTGVSAFDFDGDGASELVHAEDVGLRVFDGPTGAVVLHHPTHTSLTLYEAPLIVDVDGDGETEMVLAGNNGGPHMGVYVLGAEGGAWSRTGRVWNQPSWSGSNLSQDGSVPVAPETDLLHFRAAVVTGPAGAGDPDLATGMPHSCIEECGSDDDDPVVWIPVYNHGGGDSAATTVQVEDLWAGGVLHELDVPPIPAGEMAWVGPVVQDTSFRITVDPDGLLVDCDDTNNSWQGMGLYCACESRGAVPEVATDPSCAEADLVLIFDDWDFGDGCCTGEWVEDGEWFFYSFSQWYKVDAVANQGTSPSTPATVRVTDSLGNLLLDVEIPALAPGEAFRLPGVTYDNLVYRPALDALGGWPTVEYVLDADDDVLECDEANTYVYDAFFADFCLT